MELEQFQMERMQSSWENIVRFNLSESGVHAVRLAELLPDSDQRDRLLDIELGYSQSNGTPELRSTIAAMYPGASEENIMVTNGTSEANLLSSWLLTEPGDHVHLMLPNYMQLWGLSRSFGAEIRPFNLVEELNWAPDLDQLETSVSSKTRLIAICNPNNPTGAILTEQEMTRIVNTASRVGAWILADEVYRGAERSGAETPSFWGLYDRLIVTSGLSKAYGLPGLRIGWIVSTPEIASRAWSYHDYTTIGPSSASDLLARIALQPENRSRLLERTRKILNTNYPILRGWVGRHSDLFSVVDPRAGAIAYLRYALPLDSIELVEKLRQQMSVLIVPGGHFNMNNYLRIGYGAYADYLEGGLKLITTFLGKLRSVQTAV